MINGVAITEEQAAKIDKEREEQEKLEEQLKYKQYKNQEFPVQKHQKIALVIDTNVLLKQLNLRSLLKIETDDEFNENFEVISLNEVIKEVRDQQARDYIENGLPYDLQLKSADTYINEQDMIQTQNFAKDTGDFNSLSLVDQQVIALGIKVAREKGEGDKVRNEPLPLTEFRPKGFE